METKVLSDKAIMETKNKIINTIGAELSNGIPLSIMSMILHICSNDIDNALSHAIAGATEDDTKGE